MQLTIKCTGFEFPFDVSEFFDYDVLFASEKTPETPSIIIIKPATSTKVVDIATIWPYLVKAGFNPEIKIME